MHFLNGVLSELHSSHLSLPVHDLPNPMHHVILPVPIIGLSRAPFENSLSTLHPVPEASLVEVPIGVVVLALSMFQIVPPVSIVPVLASIVVVHPSAILLVILPVALVLVPIGIRVGPMTVFDPIFKAPIVSVPILVQQLPVPIKLILSKLALVLRP